MSEAVTLHPRSVWEEAAILVALACVLGFGYTFFMERGFFSPTLSSETLNEGIRLVSADSARTLFHSGAVLFIDSRHTASYDSGHVPGAMSLPADEFDGYRVQFESMPRSQPLVVYCDGEECNSSVAVAIRLTGMGFTNVRTFFGGWDSWVKAGLPIERSDGR
jgi:rhodanese-related sulfurtransferase